MQALKEWHAEYLSPAKKRRIKEYDTLSEQWNLVQDPHLSDETSAKVSRNLVVC